MAAISSAGKIQADYMTLLVTQLQNQNPLEPMDNNQMASQLAQLSQLEQLESMNTSFAQVLAIQQMSQGTALLGKTISYLPQGGEEVVSGKVTGAAFVNGQVQLEVGGKAVPMSQVLAVTD